MSALLLSLVLVSFVQIPFAIYSVVNAQDHYYDLSYGLTFPFATLAFCYLRGILTQPLSLFINALLLIWGVRLGLFLFVRILKMGQDWRFSKYRNTKARIFFWTFQLVVIWVVLIPVQSFFDQLQTEPIEFWSVSTILGGVLWLIGFIIESLSDYQKYVFKEQLKPNETKRWIDSGLWKYSRHPNYFGEMIMWWAISFVTLSLLSVFDWQVWVGPLGISLLITFVSGIPMLEKNANKQYKDNKQYEAYKTNTAVLIPFIY